MFLNYFISIANAINLIHTGKFLIGVKATIKLGFLVSLPVFSIDLLVSKLTNWGLENQDYITIVLGAIAIDHVLGSLKHWLIDDDFTLKDNLIGLVRKLGLVVAMGFLFEGLNIILKEQNLIKEYLNVVTRLIVFLYPAVSAFGNSSELSGGKFPPKAWIDKLQNFQKSLKPKDLMNKDNQND